MNEIKPDQSVVEYLQNEETETLDSPNIRQDGEGKYCWVYEQPMMKSFFLLAEVWRVLLIAAVIVMLLSGIISLFSSNGLDSLIGSVKVGALVLGILFVLSLPAYYLVVKVNNGKYTVLFEMDEEGIDHTQIKTEKAQALEKLTMLLGAAAGNRTAMSAGMLAATGSSLHSDFANLRKIKAYPDKNLITLNSRFIANQVYAEDEDFDFVYNYIKEHCPQASSR